MLKLSAFNQDVFKVMQTCGKEDKIRILDLNLVQCQPNEAVKTTHVWTLGRLGNKDFQKFFLPTTVLRLNFEKDDKISKDGTIFGFLRPFLLDQSSGRSKGQTRLFFDYLSQAAICIITFQRFL